jgi:hypothetical protein
MSEIYVECAQKRTEVSWKRVHQRIKNVFNLNKAGNKNKIVIIFLKKKKKRKERKKGNSEISSYCSIAERKNKTSAKFACRKKASIYCLCCMYRQVGPRQTATLRTWRSVATRRQWMTTCSGFVIRVWRHHWTRDQTVTTPMALYKVSHIVYPTPLSQYPRPLRSPPSSWMRFS